jgi:putative transposase
MGKIYVPPPGMIVRGWTVALDPTTEQAAKFLRDCGARRYAYNWAVTEIKQAFTRGAETGEYDPDVWSAWALRKRWNQVKAGVAPWWAENSKCAYSGGIADAVAALKNWHGSRAGRRKNSRARFPQLKKRDRDPLRCTYEVNPGPVRIDSARTVVLPRVGQVRAAENIRALWRHVRRGTGRILAATVREKAGRWFVSFRLEISARRQPEPRMDTVGVDIGIGSNLLVVMHPDGSVAEKVRSPRALKESLVDLRRLDRGLARKTKGSTRWRKTRRDLARIHARIVNVRKDAIHKATTYLVKTHGQVVIEDLNNAGHMRGLRSHRKAWIDVAAGELRRQLVYKAEWYGCDLWLADRWYPSSKTCSACGQVNQSLTMRDRRWACPRCRVVHDRDENAGVNLARLPASQAEAQSDRKTVLARRVVTKRVNRPRRATA